MVKEDSGNPCREHSLQQLAQNEVNPGITICMGKSCYVRGNQANLAYIEVFLKQRGLDARVDLRGKRCGASCDSGPHIRIGNWVYSGVTLSYLKGLLTKHYECT